MPAVSNNSSIFIHENADNCNLILVILHDRPRDGSGGSVAMTSTGNPSRAKVRDDRPRVKALIDATTMQTQMRQSSTGPDKLMGWHTSSWISAQIVAST